MKRTGDTVVRNLNSEEDPEVKLTTKTKCQQADVLDTSHAFVDTSKRFDIDALLRYHGFVIERRHKNTEPLWKKAKQVFTQEQAEQSVPKDQLRLAKLRQVGYYRDSHA